MIELPVNIDPYHSVQVLNINIKIFTVCDDYQAICSSSSRVMTLPSPKYLASLKGWL
jgi:hypothetical protein